MVEKRSSEAVRNKARYYDTPLRLATSIIRRRRKTVSCTWSQCRPEVPAYVADLTDLWVSTLRERAGVKLNWMVWSSTGTAAPLSSVSFYEEMFSLRFLRAIVRRSLKLPWITYIITRCWRLQKIAIGSNNESASFRQTCAEEELYLCFEGRRNLKRPFNRFINKVAVSRWWDKHGRKHF